MSNLQIATLIYGATALLYIAPTYAEGRRNSDQWPFYRVAGLALCLFWPLLTFVFIYRFTMTSSKPKVVFIDPAIPLRPKSTIRSAD